MVHVEKWKNAVAVKFYSLRNKPVFACCLSEGNSLAWHVGQKFSTKDRDNDLSTGSCAVSGAWWYEKCGYCCLNCNYYSDEKMHDDGITWYHWKNNFYSMKFTEMKIRPGSNCIVYNVTVLLSSFAFCISYFCCFKVSICF